MTMLPERIKILRVEKNWTQLEVSQKLKIGRSTYIGYEKGTSQPSNEMIIVLANLYNVTTDYILGNIDLKLSPAETEFVNEIELSNAELMKRFRITVDNHELPAEQILSLIDVARDIKKLSENLRELDARKKD